MPAKKKMTPRERMLTALEGGIPDRLPATLHQWQPYHLQRYMDGMSDLQAFRTVGLDAAITLQEAYVDQPDANWLTEQSAYQEESGFWITCIQVTTPEGMLTMRQESSAQTAWTVEPLIKHPEDMLLIKKYLPIPRLEKESVRQKLLEIGVDGILRGFIFGDQVGPWQHACCLYGVEKMIYATYDDPCWVHEFLSALTEKKLQYIDESLAGAAFDLIETGGGAGSSTVISPDIFREFCLPYDRQLHDALHEIGHKVVYHTCGGMMAILEFIVENGCDASETLSPPGIGGDANHREIKRRIGDKVCLIGGMDQHNILTDGDPESIKREVKRLFQDLGPKGGYIMSACDHFFETPVRNLAAYARAAMEYCYD
jgi:uroporphyrinogen-III decarboxylase